MMFCRGCGTQNAEGTATGTACGAVLANPFQASGTREPHVPLSQKPANYLIHSILATIFCCIPFGIVSIIYAAQVDSKWSQGDTHGALQASANAKRWLIISLITGVVVAIVMVIFYAILIFFALSNAGAQGDF